MFKRREAFEECAEEISKITSDMQSGELRDEFEELFPKGKCKQRGEALLYHGLVYAAFIKLAKSLRNKLK